MLLLAVVNSEIEKHGLRLLQRDGVKLLIHPEIDGYIAQFGVPFYEQVLIDAELDVAREAGEALVRKIIADAAHRFKVMLYKKTKSYVEAHAKEEL